MKKIYLLPRAERIRNDEFDQKRPEPKVVKKRDTTTAWGILIICTLGLSCVADSMIIIGIGTSFFLTAFSKYTGNDLSVIKAKGTLWKKFPYIVFGTALIFCGIIGTVSELSGSELLTSKVVKKLLTVFIAIVLGGFIIRLIFLIAATAALSKRKKNCTSPVMAEFIGYASLSSDISMNREESHGLDPLFRYHYEAVNYRFAVSEDSPLLEDTKDRFEIYIDPDQPDAYYHKEMSEDNKEIFINYLITVGLYIILPASFLIPIFLF